ncbi:MAG: MarR family transcriptional regulator [Desulfobulbaceae bacterium]|nr:MarR family transcriptional regulator [Desulfobulbaceae bacterium]
MNAEKQTATEIIPTPNTVSSENLAGLFHQALRFMMRAHHHEGHAEHAQMRVLALIKDAEPMNQRDLLEKLHVRSASLSELLAKLERRNLISRARDERDKRNFIITLTEEGAAATLAVGPSRQRHTDAIFAALSADERGQLARLLEKVVASLEQHVSEYHHDGGEGGHDERGHHHRGWGWGRSGNDRGRHHFHALFGWRRY